MKINSKTALIKSLLYEFHLDKPTIDATMSKVDFPILLKAVNFVRRYKPYDLVWLRAKVKEYQKQSKAQKVPFIEPPSMSKETYLKLKKKLDEHVSNLKLK